MASKDAKIKQLQLDKEDLEAEVNALAEEAGTLFVNLLAAASTIDGMQALLEIDLLAINVANMVIEDKNEQIDRLERAERRRERAEADKQRDADHLKGLHDRPAMANWVLVNTKAMVDGMLMTAEPNRYGRKRTVEVEIDRYGNDSTTTATTTGTATLNFTLPVFGPQSAYATIEHVVTGEKPDSKDVRVRNTVEFKFEVGGTTRTIKIVSGGKIERGCGWYVDEEYTQVLVGEDVYFSYYADKYRGSDAKDAEISTTSMTERRSGGCGW